MNILLLASHAIAEYDDIRMFTDLGHDVFCPGGYQNPRIGVEGMRPGIPEATVFPELIDACERVRAAKGDPGDMIDWAKAALPGEVVDWADVIIAHHFVDRWIAAQWDDIRHKRVIWRTCGQSNHMLEAVMAPLRRRGLQIVRYSPKERNLPNYAGEDAVIRFGKYPGDYGPWIGDQAVVGNVTQHMAQRGDSVGFSFWTEATRGLPVKPAGPGSELIGGTGALSYDEMREYLRHIRCYLYTGTQPASYTLGLIEAMLTGVPVISIGPEAFGPGYVADLFEGHEIAGLAVDEPGYAADALDDLLGNAEAAAILGASQRQNALDLFDVGKVGQQWQEFLS